MAINFGGGVASAIVIGATIGNNPTVSGILWNSAGVLASGPNTTTTTGSMVLGGAAVDTAPVAQTLSVQNTLAGGTSNVAGAAFTIAGSQGKGTGLGGAVVFQTAPAGSTGTAVNALVEAARFDSAGRLLIGTTAVSFTNAQKFEVNGGLSAFVGTDASRAVVNIQNLDATVSTVQPGIFFRDAASNNRGGFGVQNDASTFNMWGYSGLNFYTGTTSFANLRLTIGTTSIAATLPITVPGTANAMITSSTTFTSGAAAALGTLTNAPTAGNPTSWIKIVDNGVTRYIPAW